MTHPTQITTIVTRCTRDGRVNWTQVGKMVGMTADKAKAEYEHLATQTKGEKA